MLVFDGKFSKDEMPMKRQLSDLSLVLPVSYFYH